MAGAQRFGERAVPVCMVGPQPMAMLRARPAGWRVGQRAVAATPSQRPHTASACAGAPAMAADEAAWGQAVV